MTKQFSYGPNNLRKYREAAGMRQLDVAQAIGHSSTDRISRWEHGTAVPHLVNLFKLAALYKVSVEELYGPCLKAFHEQQVSDSSQLSE